ncbi:MAG: galactose oxidase [Planctomycetota bacterium]|nr:galactose oxidase [Planctomycetota bacterium]
MLIAIFSSLSASSASDLLIWNQLPSLPSIEGFAGLFAGTQNDVLIVAGGASFPDKMPWEGGKKVWYDRVYALESIDGKWKDIGKLPRSLGYGVSISIDDSIICIGGSDSHRHYADCFRIQYRDGRLVTTLLPSLPKPCANSCGTMIKNVVYVAGGLESPTATSTLKTFWSLDLADSNAVWKEHETWPGSGRMLSVAAALDESFYLFSGADLKTLSDGSTSREYLRDAYSYQPNYGWRRIADMPRPTVAAPSPAAKIGESTLLIISGDDGEDVDFQPIEKHPGFPKSGLTYNTINNSWEFKESFPFGHVTTSSVQWHNHFIIPSGEIRPGKRSPNVWSLRSIQK